MLIGSDNAERIWNFLKSKGLNDYAAAGCLGNLDAESGLSPKNLQDSCQTRLGFNDDEYTALVDSGVYTRTQFIYDQSGYGIAQWTYFSRKAALYDYAKSRSRSIGDLQIQLEFFYKELSESFPVVLSGLKTVKLVRDASELILLKYECPEDTGEAVRIKRASLSQKYYTRFSTNQNKEVVMGYITFAKGTSKQLSEHFNSTEFDCHGSGCCSQTKVNEKLIKYLEQIRTHFNAPVTITSPYRCPIHNSRPSVGGAPGSRHTKGDAADIVVKGIAPRKVAQYAESIGVLGVGLYETSKDGFFVHIDARDYKSFWYGQSEQAVTTFGVYSGPGNANPNIQNTNNLNTILNVGDRGSAVKSMQEKLIKLGFYCGDAGADGDFGQATYNAVKNFQKKIGGLVIDGIAGCQTLTAIDKALSALTSSKNGTVKITADILNVRSGPGMGYAVVSNVRKGTIYKLVEETTGWGKIENPSGWISSQYYENV